MKSLVMTGTAPLRRLGQGGKQAKALFPSWVSVISMEMFPTAGIGECGLKIPAMVWGA